MPVKFKSIFKKRKKRPIETLSNIKKPYLEEAFVKFPGQKLTPVSQKREKYGVGSNYGLIGKLQKKYGNKYAMIHTHSGGIGVPSPNDVSKFIGLEGEKTSIIVPLDAKNKQPIGYFVMKKNRDYDRSKIDPREFENTLELYGEGMKVGSMQNIVESLKNIADKYHFSYRFFPAKGFRLPEEAQGFKSSRQPLETMASAVSIIFLLLSIFFSSSNITGSAILGAQDGVGLINVGLLILGLLFVGLVVYFEKVV